MAVYKLTELDLKLVGDPQKIQASGRILKDDVLLHAFSFLMNYTASPQKIGESIITYVKRAIRYDLFGADIFQQVINAIDDKEVTVV